MRGVSTANAWSEYISVACNNTQRTCSEYTQNPYRGQYTDYIRDRAIRTKLRVLTCTTEPTTAVFDVANAALRP